MLGAGNSSPSFRREIPTLARRAPETRRRAPQGGEGGTTTGRRSTPRVGAPQHLLEGRSLVRLFTQGNPARGQVRPRRHARRDAGRHPQGTCSETNHPPPRWRTQQGTDGGRHRPPHPLPLLSQGRGREPRRLLQGLVDRKRFRHHRAERLRRANLPRPRTRLAHPAGQQPTHPQSRRPLGHRQPQLGARGKSGPRERTIRSRVVHRAGQARGPERKRIFRPSGRNRGAFFRPYREQESPYGI